MKKVRISQNIYVEFWKGRKMVSEDQDWDYVEVYVHGNSRLHFQNKENYKTFRDIIKAAREDGKWYVRSKFAEVMGVPNR